MGISPGGKLVTAGEAAVKRSSGTFGGPIDGDVKIGFSVVDGDDGRSLEAHFDAAALVYTPPGAIDIGKAHDDTRDNVAAMIQCIRQPFGDVVAQTVGQIEVVGVDLNLHLIPHP